MSSRNFKYYRKRFGILIRCANVAIITMLLCYSTSHAFRNGTDIDERRWPEIGEIGAICSATLISYDRALTAAHCLCLYLQNGATHCEKTARVRIIDDKRRGFELHGQVYVHHTFRKLPGNQSTGTDLAVIMIDEPSRQKIAYYGLDYMPLAPLNWQPQIGMQLDLVSWGPAGPRCRDFYGKNLLRLPVLRIESPLMKFIDSARHGCDGDSGSPAIWGNKVVGVAQGGNPGGLTTYTLTSPYYNWIMGPH